MHDRSEWVEAPAGPVRIKNKTYTNLVEFTRRCATCNAPFSIYVTKKIACGEADSNNFGYKNCELHRKSPVRGVASPELETLRMQNQVMKEELTGLYAKIRDLTDRLALYELPAAMQEVSKNSFPWA